MGRLERRKIPSSISPSSSLLTLLLFLFLSFSFCRPGRAFKRFHRRKDIGNQTPAVCTASSVSLEIDLLSGSLSSFSPKVKQHIAEPIAFSDTSSFPSLSFSSLKSQLVIARCRESLGWLVKELANFESIVIYNKCNFTVDLAIPEEFSSSVILFSHPNVGSCDAVYLSHILTFWDDLAENTVFYKGTEVPSCTPTTLLSILTTPPLPQPYFPPKLACCRSFAGVTYNLKIKNNSNRNNNNDNTKTTTTSPTITPTLPFKPLSSKSMWHHLFPGFSFKKLELTHFSNDPYALNLTSHSSRVTFGAFVEELLGQKEKNRFFSVDFLCMKGYFGAERSVVRRNSWSLYASLRNQQKFQVEEIDHFIERMWGRMLSIDPPLSYHSICVKMQ